MRQVVRWRPLVSPRDRAQPDPTRWLPADFTPSANRYVVQRRPNLRRLPRWKRPDQEGAGADELARPLVARANAARARPRDGRERARRSSSRGSGSSATASSSREMWRRERPAIAWRAIYHELKRLEFRGEVRRGYFVRGLSGAQFALPEAVEMLRSTTPDETRRPIVMTASDPANVFVAADAAGSGARCIRAPAQPRRAARHDRRRRRA